MAAGAVVASLLLAPSPALAEKPAPATPAVAVVPPGDMLVATGVPCTPRGPYCWRNFYWEKRGKKAIKWSDTHPYNADRFPVPYPMKTSWYAPKHYYVVYEVRYGTKPQTYKFGITRQQPWTKRSKVGVRLCKISGHSKCRSRWVAVADSQHGFYWARYLEASLVRKYANSHGGDCPPGQWISCR